MQQHHIDPIDVHPPQYCLKQVADEPRQPIFSHRLRQFLFQASILGWLISVACVTLAAV